MRFDDYEPNLPTWVWLWAPAGLTALIVPATLLDWTFMPPLYGELGIIELLTASCLVVAIVGGVSILRNQRSRSKWTWRWVLLLTVGCVYFLGEELSWGQHIFGWATPEFWAAINRQGETNLHNVHGLLGLQPRNLLTAAVVIGLLGTVGSMLRLWTWHPKGLREVWPTIETVPAAAVVLLLSARRGIAQPLNFSDSSDMLGGGEAKELFLAIYLMLYLSSLRVRTRPGTETAT